MPYTKLLTQPLYRLFTIPLHIKRDINIVFVISAYFLPFLLLITSTRLIILENKLKSYGNNFLSILKYYMIFVLLLTLYGGTDLARFVSYYFLPLTIFLGVIYPETSFWERILTIIIIFIFNRIWQYFPIWNINKYLDFYGGYSGRINLIVLKRYLEIVLYIILLKAIKFYIDKSLNKK
jgi:hypothetical protein